MSRIDNPIYSFIYTSLDDTLKILEKSDPKKASQVNDIPVKIN